MNTQIIQRTIQDIKIKIKAIEVKSLSDQIVRAWDLKVLSTIEENISTTSPVLSEEDALKIIEIFKEFWIISQGTLVSPTVRPLDDITTLLLDIAKAIATKKIESWQQSFLSEIDNISSHDELNAFLSLNWPKEMTEPPEFFKYLTIKKISVTDRIIQLKNDLPNFIPFNALSLLMPGVYQGETVGLKEKLILKTHIVSDDYTNLIPISLLENLEVNKKLNTLKNPYDVVKLTPSNHSLSTNEITRLTKHSKLASNILMAIENRATTIAESQTLLGHLERLIDHLYINSVDVNGDEFEAGESLYLPLKHFYDFYDRISIDNISKLPNNLKEEIELLRMISSEGNHDARQKDTRPTCVATRRQALKELIHNHEAILDTIHIEDADKISLIAIISEEIKSCQTQLIKDISTDTYFGNECLGIRIKLMNYLDINQKITSIHELILSIEELDKSDISTFLEKVISKNSGDNIIEDIDTLVSVVRDVSSEKLEDIFVAFKTQIIDVIENSDITNLFCALPNHKIELVAKLLSNEYFLQKIKVIDGLNPVFSNLLKGQKLALINGISDVFPKMIHSVTSYIDFLHALQTEELQNQGLLLMVPHFQKIFPRIHHILVAIKVIKKNDQPENAFLLRFCQIITNHLKETMQALKEQITQKNIEFYPEAHFFKVWKALHTIEEYHLFELFDEEQLFLFKLYNNMERGFSIAEIIYQDIKKHVIKNLDIETKQGIFEETRITKTDWFKTTMQSLFDKINDLTSTQDILTSLTYFKKGIEDSIYDGTLNSQQAITILESYHTDVLSIQRLVQHKLTTSYSSTQRLISNIKERKIKGVAKPITTKETNALLESNLLWLGNRILNSKDLFDIVNYIPQRTINDLYQKSTTMPCYIKSILLSIAFKRNDLLNFELLLENGATPDTYYGYSNYSLLVESILCEQKIEFTKLLLEYGAEPETIDKFDSTTYDFLTEEQLMKKRAFFERKDESYRVIQCLLDNGLNPNIQQIFSESNCLLSFAAEAHHVQLIDLFIAHGADVNFTTYYYPGNVLFQTFRYGDKDAIALLVSKGADVNQKYVDGTTLIYKAYRCSVFDLFLYLIKCPGIDLNQKYDGNTLLMHSTMHKDINYFKALMSHGADISIPDVNGKTPFMTVMHSKNSAEKLDMLFAKATPQVVNAIDSFGKSALVYALLSDNEKGLKLLLNHSIAVSSRNQHGRLAVEEAFLLIRNQPIITAKVMYKAFINGLKILLDPQFNNDRHVLGHTNDFPLKFLFSINQDNFLLKEKNKSSPSYVDFINQFEKDKTMLTLYFIKKNPKWVNGTMAGGLTLLHVALANKKIDYVDTILAALENHSERINYLSKTDKNGRTALFFLLLAMGKIQSDDANNFTELHLKRLINYGSDINHQDKTGKTPLMVAAFYNNPMAVSLLIKNGAKVNLTCALGKKAIDYAKIHNNEALANLLKYALKRELDLSRKNIVRKPFFDHARDGKLRRISDTDSGCTAGICDSQTSTSYNC